MKRPEASVTTFTRHGVAGGPHRRAGDGAAQRVLDKAADEPVLPGLACDGRGAWGGRGAGTCRLIRARGAGDEDEWQAGIRGTRGI